MRFKSQARKDNDRECYRLGFPSDLEPAQIVSWLRSVVPSLSRRSASGISRDTLVFETWANSRELAHRLLVPKETAEYITGQLRTIARGMTVTLDDSRPTNTWTAGIELGMNHPSRMLHVEDHGSVSASVLGSMQGLQGDEVVLVQWLIAPVMETQRKGRKGNPPPAEFSMLKAIAGYSSIGSEELRDRQKKLEEPNVMAIGRILARGQVGRAHELTERVESALKAVDSPATQLSRVMTNRHKVSVHSADAATPLHPPAQLNLTELSALVSWPFGHPVVAGLHVGTSRQLPATEAVPRTGRFIGTSNFPGSARPLSIGRPESLKHLHVLGPTGSGKTTLLANLIAQDMNDGDGVVVIESKGDLFNATKALIPRHRINDVIILDVTDRMEPVGFNVLEQGNPAVVIDKLTDLFQALYSDTRGVWMRELLYHGLRTLVERGGLTFVELAALVSPRTTEEIVWAQETRRGVKDPELKDFWTRWEALSKADQERNSSPLHNRIWQLTSRPELRNIIGQQNSSFFMDDVIRDNKILLVNLSGIPNESASIAGTLIMDALWSSVQRVRAEKTNYLYVDEFQDFIRLPVGAEDMLAKARGFGLSITLAHQHLAQLSSDVASAVMANARSKIVFRVESHEDARAMQRAFGSDAFSDQDFQHLKAYEAVAKIATSTGSSLVTLTAPQPATPTGCENDAVALSRSLYGRSLSEVEEEIDSRKKSAQKASHKPLPIGVKEWGE